MGICLIITIVFEYIFQEINIFLPYREFTDFLIIIFVNNLFEYLLDTIEKYLFEYDYVNPFKVLMFEGFYGFFLSFSLLYFPELTMGLKTIYINNSSGSFILFIFLLFVYFILCGLKNAYRVITTKLYSPMTRAFTDNFLNPLILIFYFGMGFDFITHNKIISGFYFLVNFIVSVINSFFGLVFNEILILFCCGLERNTHAQISLRADSKFEIGLTEITDDDDDESEKP